MDKLNIRMVDLYGQYLKIKDEIDSSIQEVLDNTAFINGPQVGVFEQNFGSYLGTQNVVACANGTDALQIALMSLELQQGDEVLLPAHTYVATAEVVALLKLNPIYVEVNYATFNLEIEDLKKKITPRTKVIVPVHLYGQCANMAGINDLARDHNLFVIEDTAQAVGASYTFPTGEKRMAGTMGDIGCFSFFPSKNLGCFGDGGAMVFRDSHLAEKARIIANHGQKIKYHHDVVGCNSRLDTLQSAILTVKLKYLNQYISARQQVAEKYNLEFKSVAGFITPEVNDHSTHVYHQYTIKCAGINRDKLKEELKRAGIPTMIYYPIPLHFQKAYKSPNFQKGSLPVTEQLSNEVLSFPIHTELSASEQDYIIDTTLEIVNQIDK